MNSRGRLIIKLIKNDLLRSTASSPADSIAVKRAAHVNTFTTVCAELGFTPVSEQLC